MLRVLFNLIGVLLIMTSPAYAAGFNLTSPTFNDQSNIPIDYTCDGKDLSPELKWSDVPTNTKSLALIVSDPDAPRGVFYHWILFNIPVSITGLAQGIGNLPQGTLVGKNDFGNIRYNGPCPPKGSPHHYIFTLYALDTTLNLSAAIDANTLLKSLQKHIIGKAILTGLYQRA